jgi:hypothetical protein
MNYTTLALQPAILQQGSCIGRANIRLQYVVVYYQGDDKVFTYAYGACYPYTVMSELAQLAVFCRTAVCYNFP